MKEREFENNNCVGRAMLDTCFLFDWCYYLSQLLPQPVHGYIYGTEKNVQCEAAPHRLELGQTNALPFTKGNIWFSNWLLTSHILSTGYRIHTQYVITKVLKGVGFFDVKIYNPRFSVGSKEEMWYYSRHALSTSPGECEMRRMRISTKIESSQENTLDLHPATRR